MNKPKVKISDNGIDIDIGYVTPCCQCGMCCLKAPCGYGAKIENGTSCKFLTEPNEKLQRFCSKYKEIEEIEKDNPWAMFGCGCSSSLFNNYRKAIFELAKQLKEKQNVSA